MPDYRFEGVSLSGKRVHGVIDADNMARAKEKVAQLAESRRFKVERILARRVFLYRACRGKETPVTGQQKAFSADEVREALERLGYAVTRISPKLFSLRMKPPSADIVTFVRVSADLLREKLPFNEILQLLVNDIENPSLRESIKEINNDLHHGKDSEEAFMRQEKTLGKFTARMLGMASKSGSMVDIYESTAIFLERQTDFKKTMKSALITPAVTMLALAGAVIFYIAYIFPKTAEMFLQMGTELPPMTAATMKFSGFLLNNTVLLVVLILGLFTAAWFILRMPKVQLWKAKMMFKLPVMGSMIHKTTIEIFCRVFYALYSGSGESVDAIRLSAEACGNRYMEHRIKTVAIPMMLSQGVGLVQSLEAAGVFTKTALARFHSGAETGTIKNTALQLANYYQKETVYKMKNIVDLVQIIVSLVIMIVITGLTMVSSETAMMKPKTF